MKSAVDSKTFLITCQCRSASDRGRCSCSPFFFSTSWQNDQTPQAMGHYMNQKGVKTVFLIGPELRGWQGHAGGRRRPLSKARLSAQELTKWPDQLDFSAELAKAKAANPDAIFVFYPGRAGVQFLTQYAQAGLKGQDPAVHRLYDRRAVAAAAEGPCTRRAGCAAMGERSAERGQQKVRRRLLQKVSGKATVVLRCAVL